MAETMTGRRREVHYASLEEFRVDAQRLAAGPCRTVGNWSYGQILLHLAQAVNFSLDGFPHVAAWPLRLLVRVAFKKALLHKPMKSGYRLPGRLSAMLPDPETATGEGLAALQQALDRFASETPTAIHPVLGRLTPEEWTLLHLRHAELHMSFAWPIPS